MDIYCRVTSYGLIPLYDSDYDLSKKLRVGTTVRCRISLPRNYEFHKKFFALVRLTFENLPYPLVKRWNINSLEDMVKRFKYDLGYYQVTYIDGEKQIEYKSISFAEMDQEEFEEFYNASVNLVLTTYIRGIDKDDLKEEVENFK